MREAAGNWTDYREIVAGIRELPASVGDRHKQNNGDKQNDRKPRRN